MTNFIDSVKGGMGLRSVGFMRGPQGHVLILLADIRQLDNENTEILDAGASDLEAFLDEVQGSRFRAVGSRAPAAELQLTMLQLPGFHPELSIQSSRF